MSDDIEDLALAINMSLHHSACLRREISLESMDEHSGTHR